MTLRRPKNARLARNPTLAESNLLDCTHLPLNPSAFPLSTHNSGRMKAYSEVVKRHPEAWKTALTSRIPFSRRRSQAIYSTPRPRRHPKIRPRYVRDIPDIVIIFSERASASAARRRARASALPFWFSMPSQKGRPALNSNFVGDAASRAVRPRHSSSNFRTFHLQCSPAPSISPHVQHNTRNFNAPRTSSQRPTCKALPTIRDRGPTTPGLILAQTYALIAPRARKTSPSSKTSPILRGRQSSAPS